MTALQAYDAYVARLQAAGHKTDLVTMPCCGGSLQVVLPLDEKQWDSLITCPHCSALAMKVATPEGASVRIRPVASALDGAA